MTNMLTSIQTPSPPRTHGMYGMNRMVEKGTPQTWRCLVTLVIILLATPLVHAQVPIKTCNAASTYYIDYVNGDDTRTAATAKNKATPWKHVNFMSGATSQAAAYAPQPDDCFIFKGGTVVSFFAGTPGNKWNWDSFYSGTSGHEIYFGYDPTWNDGTVLSIRPTSSGYACTTLNVVVSGGGGSGAAGTASFMTTGYLAGLLQHVTVTNAGSGYTSNPTVSFTGTCNGHSNVDGTDFPTAVADIYSPIFDLDGGTTVWDNSNGAAPGLGPISFPSHYLIFDHIDVRNGRISTTQDVGGAMFTIGGTDVLLNQMYFHNYGTVPSVITPVNQAVVLLNITGSNATTQSSFFDNYETEYTTGPCGFNGSTPANFDPPCGQGTLAAGSTTFTNNIVHDGRGLVYTIGGVNNIDFHGNTIWNNTYDVSNQHADTLYIFSGGKIYDNIIHDSSPLSSANIYVEMQQSSVCLSGSIFNNVVWNVGVSTPPIGHTGEFYTTACGAEGPPVWNDYNNTLYAKDGTNVCINAGQWSTQFVFNINIRDNHCITTGASSEVCDGVNTCPLFYSTSSGGLVNHGTWNGLSNPNDTATQTAINAVNVIQTPANATTQGYKIDNLFAVTAGGITATTAGIDIDSILATVPQLGYDINGATRPAGTARNYGAYQLGGGTGGFSISGVTISGIKTQ